MKKSSCFFAILLFFMVVLFSRCNAPQANSQTVLEEAKKAIAESNGLYFEAFAKNDANIFINSYAKDACIMAPGTKQLCGPEAAATFFKTAYNEYGLRNGKFITTAVYGDGMEFVTEEGLWQSFNEKGELFDDGKFLVLWKKTAAGWKMFRDSFSSNRK